MSVWDLDRNPRQTFAVAMTILIEDAPRESLERFAEGDDRIPAFYPSDARLLVTDRKGTQWRSCPLCMRHVKKLYRWYGYTMCADCRADKLSYKRASADKRRSSEGP